MRDKSPSVKTILSLTSAAVLIHVVLTWMRAIQRGRRARLAMQHDAAAAKYLVQDPAVSILVPAWCEHGTIEACILSLQAIDYPIWEALILAGGPDGTYEMACQLVSGDERFRVIERGPEPKNVALTKGFEMARHDVLVLLDADSVVAPDWLGALIKPITAGAAASFGMHFPQRITWVSMEEHMEIIQAYQILGTNMAQGCSSLAIRRDVLDQLGPLPAKAYSWEDWDIDVRLIHAGHESLFAEDACLTTDRPATLGQFWTNSVRCQRSHLAGLWYHRSIFFKHRVWAIQELLFFAISSTLGIAAIAGALVATTHPSRRPTVLKAAALILLSILGRRAALGAEVAAYTGERKWLGIAWTPALLLPIQMAAAVVALVGVRKQPSFDYKGPRQSGT